MLCNIGLRWRESELAGTRRKTNVSEVFRLVLYPLGELSGSVPPSQTYYCMRNLFDFYSLSFSSKISTMVFSVPTMPGEAIKPIFRMVSSGVFPLIPCTLSMWTPCRANATERKAASQAATPFMVQPWFPPSQIIPVMEEAMLLRVYSICSTEPPFK